MTTVGLRENPYHGLRQRALTIAPDAVNLPYLRGVPFAVLMETGSEKAVVTLVSPSDGLASPYFSNGGGIIGGVHHASDAEASKKFVAASNSFTLMMQPATEYPLPEIGKVRLLP